MFLVKGKISLVLVTTGAMPKIPNSIIQRGESSKSHPIENDSFPSLGEAAKPAIIPPSKEVNNVHCHCSCGKPGTTSQPPRSKQVSTAFIEAIIAPSSPLSLT